MSGSGRGSDSKPEYKPDGLPVANDETSDDKKSTPEDTGENSESSDPTSGILIQVTGKQPNSSEQPSDDNQDEDRLIHIETGDQKTSTQRLAGITKSDSESDEGHDTDEDEAVSTDGPPESKHGHAPIGNEAAIAASPLSKDDKKEAKGTINYTEKAEDWIKLLGNYEIEVKDEKDPKKAPKIETTEESHSRVEALLSKEGLDKLYEETSVPVDKDDATKARREFIDALVKIIEKEPKEKTSGKEAIKLDEFFERYGDKASHENILDLYKNAVKEESNSKAFRDAVFLNSITKSEGQKWKKRMVLWIGGPSASGKSYATKAVIDKVAKVLMPKEEMKASNNVVSIDGGIERQVSQIRQLILQTVLHKGYVGIKDLEKVTKKAATGVKKKVQKAVLAPNKNETLHLAIPCTFTTAAAKEQLYNTAMNKFAKDNDVMQIFSKVTSEKSKAAKNRFEDTVKRSGVARAWSKKTGSTNITEIKINNLDIDCESKEYEDRFESGKRISAVAGKNYARIQRNRNKTVTFIRIKSDLAYIWEHKKGEWVECSQIKPKNPNEKIYAITLRAFEEWKKTDRKESPETWFNKLTKDKQQHYKKMIVNIEGDWIDTPMLILLRKDEGLKGKHSKPELINFAECMQSRLKMYRSILNYLKVDNDLLNECDALINSFPKEKDDRFIQAGNEAYSFIIETFPKLPNELKPRILNLMTIPGSTLTEESKNTYLKSVTERANRYETSAKDEKSSAFFIKEEEQKSESFLGTVLINNIMTGGDKAANAVDSIFEIVKNLEPAAQCDFFDNFIEKFDLPNRTTLKVGDKNFYEVYKNETNIQNKMTLIGRYRQSFNEHLQKEAKSPSPEQNQAIWMDIINSIPQDSKNHTNIFTCPVAKPQRDQDTGTISDESLRAYLSKEMNSINNFRYVSPLPKAPTDAPMNGQYIVCYLDENDNIKTKKLFIKQSENLARNPIDSLVSRLKNLVANDHIASSFLVKDASGIQAGAHVYSASIGIEDYQELYREAGLNSRPPFAGSRDLFDNGVIQNTVEKLKNDGYTGFEACLMAALLVDDRDVHSENLGIKKTSGLFINIDHNAAASKGLTLTINNNPSTWEVFTDNFNATRKGESTHHETEYRDHQRNNKKMADVILQNTNHIDASKIESIITDEINTQANLLDLESFKKYAKRLFPDSKYLHNILHPHEVAVWNLLDLESFKNYAKKLLPNSEYLHNFLHPHEAYVWNLILEGKPINEENQKNFIAESLKKLLSTVVPARLLDLRRVAMDQHVSLCFEWDKETKKFILVDGNTLQDLIRQHPNYFRAGKFNFIGKSEGVSRADHALDLKENIQKHIDYTLYYYDKPNSIEDVLADADKVLSLSAVFSANELANTYIQRLNLIIPLTSSPKLKQSLEQSRELLNKYKEINNTSERDYIYCSHLTQICDSAYTSFVKAFNNIPLDEGKIRLYQALHEHLKSLKLLKNEANSDDEPTLVTLHDDLKLDIMNSQLVQEIQDRLEALNKQKDKHKHNAHSKQYKIIDQLDREISKLTRELDDINIKPKNLNHESKDDENNSRPSFNTNINSALQSNSKKSAAEPKQTQQLYFYFSRPESKLGVIPIHIPQDKSAFEALTKDKRFSHLINPDNQKNPPNNNVMLSAKVIADIVSENKAMFLPNPVDNENEDKPTSGFLMAYDKKSASVNITEIKQKKELTIAHLLTKILTKEITELQVTCDPDVLQKKIQDEYVNHIQSELSPPESVNTKNLQQMVDKLKSEGLCKIDLFKSTKSIAEKISAKFYDKTHYEGFSELPSIEFLAMAQLCFESMKANPNVSLENFTIQNTQGNPMFFQALFLCAELNGLNQRLINFTGYEDLYASNRAIEFYKKEMNNPKSKLCLDIKNHIDHLEGNFGSITPELNTNYQLKIK